VEPQGRLKTALGVPPPPDSFRQHVRGLGRSPGVRLHQGEAGPSSVRSGQS